MQKRVYAQFRKTELPTPSSEFKCDDFGDNLFTALRKHGVTVPRRVAVAFSPLSDEELEVACNELARFVRKSKPSNLFERAAYRLVSGLEVIHEATIIGELTPTYVSICGAKRQVGKEFWRATQVDGDDERNGLSLVQLLWPTYTKQRVDTWHGALMCIIADRGKDTYPYNDMGFSDMEWIGSQREKIIPLWNLVSHEDNFNRSRMDAILNGGSEDGALALMDGVL